MTPDGGEFSPSADQSTRHGNGLTTDQSEKLKWVVDTASGRLGKVVGRNWGLLQLRAPSGRKKWECLPGEARPATAEEKQQAGVPPLELVLGGGRAPFVVDRYGGVTRGACA
ncbi:hypothetical protein [Streptomyces luteireticuli]|uniref:Uncharacterized protein n=1 Tax=Streptomyces luteireticuli TaxID=173858 RepID=A0ABN0YRU1_9ACTN